MDENTQIRIKLHCIETKIDFMKGSQTKKIKAIMEGSYANMVSEQTSSRLNGALFGLVGGIIIGSFLRQNSLMTGVIGGAIGYFVSNRKSKV